MKNYLQPFTAAERANAEDEVKQLATSLQGRKVEEGDWTALYCRVKNAPFAGWSNLPFRDYIYQGVGVEFKLLCRENPIGDVGRSLMHPSATRTITFDPDGPAQQAMREVLTQWGNQIRMFEERIRASSPRQTVDARWGILLWSPDHTQFLYFEERLIKPDPGDFKAEWHDGSHRGKATRNLHIFERSSSKKKFSCTLPKNGAKLQPYFDIPTEAEGACLFKVEKSDLVPLYISSALRERLAKDFPGLGNDQLIEQLLAEYHRAKRT